MNIELRITTQPMPEFIARSYDADLDDVRSILMDACGAMASSSEFLVSGFGQDRWPVDNCTDLAILLEQLPDALEAIATGGRAEISFYEQGMERTITLKPQDGEYLATCSSWGSWQTACPSEAINRADLAAMLMSVQTAFMEALAKMAPDLAQHAWIQQWRNAATMSQRRN